MVRSKKILVVTTFQCDFAQKRTVKFEVKDVFAFLFFFIFKYKVETSGGARTENGSGRDKIREENTNSMVEGKKIEGGLSK